MYFVQRKPIHVNPTTLMQTNISFGLLTVFSSAILLRSLSAHVVTVDHILVHVTETN